MVFAEIGVLICALCFQCKSKCSHVKKDTMRRLLYLCNMLNLDRSATALSSSVLLRVIILWQSQHRGTNKRRTQTAENTTVTFWKPWFGACNGHNLTDGQRSICFSRANKQFPGLNDVKTANATQSDILCTSSIYADYNETFHTHAILERSVNVGGKITFSFTACF